MPAPRVLLLVVGALLVATACSGDSDSKGGSATSTTTPASTTAAGSQTSQSVPDPTVPDVQKVSDAEFAEVANALDAEITAAGNDPCLIIGVLAPDESTPAPANAAQGELAMRVMLSVIDRLADAAPAGSASDTDVLRKAVVSISEEAAAVGYDPAKLGTISSFNGSELSGALESIGKAAKCG